MKHHAKKTIVSWFLGQSRSLFFPPEPFVFILSESNHILLQLVTNDHINLQYSSTSRRRRPHFLLAVEAAAAHSGNDTFGLGRRLLCGRRRVGPGRCEENKTTRGSSNSEYKEKAYLVSRG